MVAWLYGWVYRSILTLEEKTLRDRKMALHRYITPGLILVTSLSLAGFAFVYSPDRLHTEFDDSYMYCRYASNFLSGHGFSWNAQDGPSHGATSPAYLVLITMLKRIFLSENSLLLSIASFSAGLAGLLLLVLSGYARGGA